MCKYIYIYLCVLSSNGLHFYIKSEMRVDKITSSCDVSIYASHKVLRVDVQCLDILTSYQDQLSLF